MTKIQPGLALRPAMPEDSSVCGRICYDAFSTLNGTHGFPCDFPGPDAAIGMLSMMFSHPGFYCVVAESDGRIVGSNCLDVRSIIAGVGPITVDRGAQSLGVGRKLMQAVMDRANQQGAAGIRLVQAAFHNRSLSLYASLGFDVREPLACMQGRTLQRTIPGCTVRPAQPADADACNAVSRRVHGFDRGTDLQQAIQQGTAKVVEREGRITGYATDLAFFTHATAETNPDLHKKMMRVTKAECNQFYNFWLSVGENISCMDVVGRRTTAPEVLMMTLTVIGLLLSLAQVMISLRRK